MSEEREAYVGSADIAIPNYLEAPEAFAAIVVAARQLRRDIDNVVHSAARSVFAICNSTLRDATTAAYPLYLHILAHRQEALSAITTTPPYDGRQRAPKGDAATIALTLATVPQNRRESSIVSDYRCFLILAGQQNVKPEQYSAWLQDAPSLKEVVSLVRSQRAKPKVIEPPETALEMKDASCTTALTALENGSDPTDMQADQALSQNCINHTNGLQL